METRKEQGGLLASFMPPETPVTQPPPGRVPKPAEAPAAEAAPAAAATTAPAAKKVVVLSDTALAELQRLRAKKDKDEIVLRIGVKGGGCAGLTYTMSFDSEIKETDHVSRYDGVTLIVDRKSAVFLKGMTLNYSDDLIGGGFKFENPNAKKSCSCGTSFSA
jgi:iron-sulfur cluster assembly protein